jgi:hypothetical protein
VTVKGKPCALLVGGARSTYESGSGSDTLVFSGDGRVTSIELSGGVIVASQASANMRFADLTMPAKP